MSLSARAIMLGNPVQVGHRPDMLELVGWMETVEALSQVSGRLFFFDTSGDLSASSGHVLDDVAFVSRDPVEANRGVYRFGASGWGSPVAELPGAFFSPEFADKARAWATEDEDVAVEPDEYSARHHAIKAAASAGVAGGFASAASGDATAAGLSETNAASAAAAALARANAAALSEAAAAGAAAEAVAAALAGGAPFYASVAAGVAAVADGGLFVVVESGAAAVYQRAGGAGIRQGFLTRPSFASVSALSASGVGVAGEIRFVTGSAGGSFVWTAGNLSGAVAWDTQMGIYVPPAIQLNGTAGAWVRVLDGYLTPKMFGATGSGDDTDAIVCMDNVFRELSPTFSIRFTSSHTTAVGMGELVVTHTYATRAEADAALSGLAEHNVVLVLADETLGGGKTRWRVKDGAFARLSLKSYNKKFIDAEGINALDLVLAPGSHAEMCLLAASFQQGGIHDLRFNGNSPGVQWGQTPQPKLNPDTRRLVYIEGYGVDIRNVTVRHSGGDGIHIRGIIGAFEVSGGGLVTQYNTGWGLVLDRISSFKATVFWGEGNEAGDFLMRHDVTKADATSQSYWKKAAVEIQSIYSENASGTAPVVQIEGGHFAPRVGIVALQGDNDGPNRPVIKLADSQDADGIWQGCQGGYFDLGGINGARIECSANSRNNVFIRAAATYTSAYDDDAWDVRDDGVANVFEWAALSSAAFEPHKSIIGDVSVNSGSSNFVNNSGASAQLINTPGGMVGPVQDYHPNFPAGPAFVRGVGFNTKDGGAELNSVVALNANIPAVLKTWYAILLGRFEAHQLVKVAVIDATDPSATNWLYYNWVGGGWTLLANANDFGVYRTLRADRRHISYALPFLGDGVARQVRVQVRVKGGGDCDLYHTWVTDYPAPALVGIRAGQCLGMAGAAKCTTALLPPASAIEPGVDVFDVTAGVRKTSNGGAWV